MAYFHGILVTEINDMAGAPVVVVPPSLPTVTLSADISKAEGNSGPTLYVFTVSRSATSGAVSVPWAFSAGSTSASDYTGTTLPAGGTVTMADGVPSGTFTISVAGDTDVEPDELFGVSITAPAGYILGARSSATGGIVNDDSLTGPTYADADLNTAFAFKRKVLSYDQGSGDRAAQLFAAFPALKAFLGVGHKAQSLTAGSTNPGWNASAERLDLSTGAPSISGLDVQGMVYIPSGVAADTVISDCRIRHKADGSVTSYKVQKDNSDALYKTTIRDVTMEGGQANDVSYFDIARVLTRFSETDNFKGGMTGGTGRTQRIVSSWGEACGYNNPAAHGDGIQWSTTGDSRLVACGLYSAPVPAASGTLKYTGGYGTSSYGLTNAIRIDASGAPKLVERVHVLGLLSAFGGLYPLTIAAQQTDSIVRNVTMAHCILAPAAFRYDGSGGDAMQMHPSFTRLYDGGGLIENVGIFGNEVFGFGPLVYSDRGAAAQDMTGIWHWNPATIDADTVALWKDLGLLTSAGVPAPGMLRSVAATIAAQPKTIATTGAVALGLDLSAIPNDATIILHLADVAGLHELEYIA